MASSFKTIEPKDIVSTRNLLHEAIPITGTIVSGTYADNNIKNYSHGMFQSVYDYPYLSSSANHIVDLTCGYSSVSGLSGAASDQNAKKINIYNEMAQVLAGFDESGNGLVNGSGVVLQFGIEIAVMIPGCMHNIDEADAALDHSSGQ